MQIGSGFEPAGHDGFLLRVEVDRFHSLDVEIAEEGFVPAGEGEPGHRGGDADVDADHAGVEMHLELPGGIAAVGEDAGAVAVGRVAGDLDRFVNVLYAKDGEDGPEDL